MTPSDINIRDNKITRRRFAKRIFFTLAVLSLFPIIIIVLKFFYIGRILHDRPAEKSPLEIKLSSMLPSTSTRPAISVNGTLSVPGQVTLYLNEEFVGQTATISPERYDTYEPFFFSFEKITLHPGTNHLRFKAKSFDVDDQHYSSVSLDKTIEWNPNTSEDPELLLPPYTIVNAANLTVQGVAYPQSTVFINILGNSSQAGGADKFDTANFKEIGEPIPAQADDQGRFKAEVKFAIPGTYIVEAKSDSQKTLPDKTWQRRNIIYDPFRAFKTMISVGYHQTEMDFEATLDKNSPQAVGLITGEKSLAQFYEEVLGLRTGWGMIAFDFWDVTPTITTTNEATTVRATATTTRRGDLPVFNGAITIERAINDQHYFPVLGANESVSIKFDGYSAQSYYPIPDTIVDGVATWKGNRAATDFTQNIQVGVSYSPVSSPAKLFRFLSLQPYQIFGYKIASVSSLFYGFLSTVPILWTLWLLYKYKEMNWVDPHILKLFSRVCSTSLIIIYIAPVSNILDDIGMSFQRMIRPLEGIGNHPLTISLVLLIPSVLIFIIVSVLLWLTTRLNRRALSFWLRKSLGSIGYASGIYFFILTILGGFELPNQSGNPLFSLPTTVIAFAVMLCFIIYLKRLVNFLPRENIAQSKKVFFLIVLLLLVLAYSSEVAIRTLSNYSFQVSTVWMSNMQRFFYIIQDVMPYVLLAGIVLLLKLIQSKEEYSHPIVIGFGWILFVAYIVGATPNWFIIPIPLLLALKLYPITVMQPFEKRYALNLLREQVFEKRNLMLLRVFSSSQAQQFRNSLESLQKKINSGELTPADLEKRKIEVDDYATRLEQESKLAYGLKAKDVALNFGPRENNWDNGVYAAKLGLIIALPFLLAYLWTFFFEQSRSGRPYLLLWISVRIIVFLSDWMVAAFFFGYFFPYIRGESGLKKGLHIAVTVIICLSPVWFISGSSNIELTATFLRAGQIFLFFTILGVWAFDYRTFRDTLSEQFSWKKFTQFGDMPSLTAVASVLVTSIGIAVSTVMSGQFTTVVSQLVNALFPQLPMLPTK